MKRLLIAEASYRRLGRELDGLRHEILPVVMDDAGLVQVEGGEKAATAPAVDAAWANNDVFASPAARAFMVAALKSPTLEWVQSGGAGFENPVFASFVRKGAILTTQHVQAVGIADYVLWGVLDHWQRGPERRQAQAERRWERLTFREIEGSTWLIVGFGAIGQAVAERARGFGARVIGARRRSGGEHPLADRMVTDWREVLPEADVVVLSLPLNGASARMADAAAFSAFKPGSIFINVGRGGLVDEPALLSALDAGRPEHAVLDVFDAEPLPAESPFWARPQVTLTAHASAVTHGLAARSDRVFLENLRRYARGEPLRDVVSADEVLAGAG